jgi:hypothetical protein
MLPHQQETSGLRNTLVTALASCADTPLRPEARRFLRGLSSDELQFIADFLGACILQAPHDCPCEREQMAREIDAFQRACTCAASHDRDHKMILLLEFLCRSGVPAARMAAREHAVN